MNGVERQVEQDLFDLLRIDHDVGKIAWRFRMNRTRASRRSPRPGVPQNGAIAKGTLGWRVRLAGGQTPGNSIRGLSTARLRQMRDHEIPPGFIWQSWPEGDAQGAFESSQRIANLMGQSGS